MKRLEYIPGKSGLHNWHAAMKLAGFSFAIFSVAFSSNAERLCVMLCFAIVLALLSKVSFVHYLSVLRYPLYLLVLIFITLALSLGRTKVFAIASLVFYEEGMQQAMLITLRAVTIVILFSVFYVTTRYSAMIKALRSFRVPSVLIHILLSTYRYVFLFFEQIENMKKAARLRGFAMRKTFRNFKLTSGIISNMLIRGIEQSDNCQKAMLARGLSEKFQVIRMERIIPGDIVKLFLMLTVSFIIHFFPL